jgi:hypothetical protein
MARHLPKEGMDRGVGCEKYILHGWRSKVDGEGPGPGLDDGEMVEKCLAYKSDEIRVWVGLWSLLDGVLDDSLDFKAKSTTTHSQSVYRVLSREMRELLWP